MRTPDNESHNEAENETQGAEDTGSAGADTTDSPTVSGVSPLAAGFAGVTGGGTRSGDADAFGSGSPSAGTDGEPSGSDGPWFLRGDDAAEDDQDDPVAAFGLESDLESDPLPDTSIEWDVTGDGVVDHQDFEEAAAGLHDFDPGLGDGAGPAADEGFFPTE